MNPKIPAFQPKKVLRKLEKAGFKIHRTRGSHVILKNRNGKLRITIPIHGKDLKIKTLLSILQQAEIPVEEFLKI